MEKKIEGSLKLAIILGALLLFTNWTLKDVQLPKFPSEAENIVIPDEILVTIAPELMEKATVKRVIDGDTIELETGETVRYVGIDTPETKHPSKGVQCFGKEASEMNKKLVEGREILMVKDISNTDRYKRLLRYIYIPNPESTISALFVNQYLVEEGYAYSLTYPPDVKYSVLFSQLQRKADEANKGLWGVCQDKEQ